MRSAVAVVSLPSPLSISPKEPRPSSPGSSTTLRLGAPPPASSKYVKMSSSRPMKCPTHSTKSTGYGAARKPKSVV
eukprot:1559097-Pyramimonas_sp.AAC.1